MKNHNNNKPAQARKEKSVCTNRSVFIYNIMKESDNEWYKLKYYKMKD